MSTAEDVRASKRLPIANRVQLMAKGRNAMYALAINISAGGLLLAASPNLQVGSRCEVSILKSGEGSGEKITTAGTVVRSDSHGTAIQFSEALGTNVYESLAMAGNTYFGQPLVHAYLNYFKASQSVNPNDYEALLGISQQTFRTVFLITFVSSLFLAILPVWLFRASIPLAPNWLKIGTSFAYGAVWLGLIQPSADLAIFHFIRERKKG